MPISMNSPSASIVATPAGADCSSSASCSTRSLRHPLDIGLHALALKHKTTTCSGHCTQAATPLSGICRQVWLYLVCMSANTGTSGARQQRLTSYLDRMAEAAGHADRAVPLTLYCTGLLLPGERRSVEPMAARLAPSNVRRMHQSLHHVVADAPWSDEALLGCVRDYVLATMTKTSPIVSWVVDDTGLPKKGTHSVGVARQYCGQTGKQDNCQYRVNFA